MPFELRADCPSCRVEGARVETWETGAPSCRLGVPIAARCRICGHESEGRAAGVARGEGCPSCGSPLDDDSVADGGAPVGHPVAFPPQAPGTRPNLSPPQTPPSAAHRCPFCGASASLVETSPGRVPASLDELERALSAWALDEGLASAAELVEGSFVLPTAAEVFAALVRGEAVETTFDLVDYLFSSGHGQGGSDATAAPAVRVDAPPADVPMRAGTPAPAPALVHADAPPSTRRMPPPASIRRVGGPRDELLALASVAASDGDASPDDLAVLAHAAEVRGIPPLALDDIRVRRPGEIDPPPTLDQREKVLEEMFHMAFSDGELDESEVRVVREFARAWGVDPQRVTEWTAAARSRGSSRIALWIDRVGYFLFPGW